jgi:hypothetical protein
MKKYLKITKKMYCQLELHVHGFFKIQESAIIMTIMTKFTFVLLKETEYLLLSHFCLDCIIAKSERKYCQSTLHKSVTFLFAMESCKELESYFSSIYFTTLCMSAAKMNCGMM